MKQVNDPAGAPNGLRNARPNSLTAPSTASSADVARLSCSSAPLIPEVGINLASCHDSSATPCAPVPRVSDLLQAVLRPPTTVAALIRRRGESDEPGLHPAWW